MYQVCTAAAQPHYVIPEIEWFMFEKKEDMTPSAIDDIKRTATIAGGYLTAGRRPIWS